MTAPAGLLRSASAAAVAALLAALVFAGATRADSPLPSSDSLRALVEPEELARADWDALQEHWFELLDREADSPLAQLILIRLRGIEDLVTRPPAYYLKRLRARLEKGVSNPLSREALRAEATRVEEKIGTGGEPGKDSADSPDDAGALRAGMVVGPFGVPDAYLQDWVFPPEVEIDFAARYPGLGADVGWQPLVRETGDSRSFDPGSLSETADGALYALFQVESDREQAGYLRCETDASIRIFLGGDRILDSDPLAEYRPRRAFIPVALRRGWNRILVKTSSAGKSAFGLRLLAPDGAPMPGVLVEKQAVLHPEGERSSVPPPSGPAPDVRGALVEAGLLERPDDADLLACAAFVLDSNGEDSECLRLLARAREIRPGSAALAYHLGEATQRGRHLPPSYRTSRGKDYFAESLKLDPDFLPARYALALLAASDDRIEDAVKELRQIVKLAPRHYRAHLALAYFFAKLGWQKERSDAIQAAEDIAPESPEVLNARVQQALDERNALRAQSYLERTVAADRSQETETRALAALDRTLGRFDDAIALYRGLEKQRSEAASSYRQEVVATLDEKGDLPGAIAEARALMVRYPRRPTFARALGDLVYKSGDRDGALALYRKALELDPGFHEVRDLIAQLEGTPDRFFEPFRIDASAIIQAAPGRETYSKASSVAVLDDLILRIQSDGSTRGETHQAFKLLDRQGIEAHSKESLGDEVQDVRTWLPTGETLEPIEVSGEGRSQYTMPGLTEGATVEYRYRDDTSNAPGAPLVLPSFYFQDVDLKEPFLYSRYVVIAPKSLPLTIIENHMPSPPQVVDWGDDVVRIYLARGMERIRFERFMPNPRELLPSVSIGQSLSWTALNQLYKRDYKAAIRTTDELRDATRRVIEGAKDEREAAARLYKFASEHVVNVEGRGDATGILLEKQGPPLILFMGCLQAAGIEFEFGRVRVAPELDTDDAQWSWVREALFGEPVVRVLPKGSDPVIVSPGPRELPFGRVTPNLFGARVFYTGPGEGRIETIPRGSREELLLADQEVEVAMHGGENCSVVLRTSVPNAAGLALKERVRGAATLQRSQIGREALAALFPGAIASDVTFPRIEEKGAPLAFEVKGQMRSFVEEVGGKLGCLTGIPAMQLVPLFLTGEQRTWPVIYKQWNVQDSRTTIDLGDAYRAERLPEDLRVEGFLGAYSLEFRSEEEGRRVIVERRVDFGPARIPASEYPALLQFCREVDARESERIQVRAVGAGAAQDDPALAEKKPRSR